MPTFKLCNDITEGLGFMMNKVIKKNKWVIDSVSRKDDPKTYKKYNIKSIPVLLVFDGKNLDEKITSVEDITKYLEEHYNEADNQT